MSFDVVLALPTEDRGRAYAFARALGLDTPGELADDGVPEPLRVVLNERTAVMYIPTGGFGWVTAGRPTAERGTAECLVSLQVGTAAEVDDLVARAAIRARRGRLGRTAAVVGLQRGLRRPGRPPLAGPGADHVGLAQRS